MMAALDEITGLDELPFSGDVNIQPQSLGNYSTDVNLRKTFEGNGGSVTPSMGYNLTKSRFKTRDSEYMSPDGKASDETIRIGLDGDTTFGPLDLSGSATVGRKQGRGSITNFAGQYNFSNENTFSELGAAIRGGAFDFNVSRQKSTGMEPVYSGSLGINIGDGGRISYSDSNMGEPRIDARYRMEF